MTVGFISIITISFFAGEWKSERHKANYNIDKEAVIKADLKFQTPETTINCRPGINPNNDNYVIGYGSLINRESREITLPNVKYAAPVMVYGYERMWASRGQKSKATFLLAVPNEGYSMNAIYYKATPADITATDLRESPYCRVIIKRKELLPLGIKSLPRGDYWMYVQDFQDAEFPNKDFPILQTYVDVFMTGCLQIASQFNLTEYGKMCFQTTYNWDMANWVNDRSRPLYARYSQSTAKYRGGIDKIIRRIAL